MVKKTLYSFIKDYCKGSIDTDICDNTVDMGVCFVYDINENETEEVDTYDKTLEIIAKNVEVVEVRLNGRYDFPIVLNIYKFVEDNFDKFLKVFDSCFYGYDTEDIKEKDKEDIIVKMVLSFNNIVSGNISESFYDEFVEEFDSQQLRVKKEGGKKMRIKGIEEIC